MGRLDIWILPRVVDEPSEGLQVRVAFAGEGLCVYAVVLEEEQVPTLLHIFLHLPPLCSCDMPPVVVTDDVTLGKIASCNNSYSQESRKFSVRSKKQINKQHRMTIYFSLCGTKG